MDDARLTEGGFERRPDGSDSYVVTIGIGLTYDREGSLGSLPVSNGTVQSSHPGRSSPFCLCSTTPFCFNSEGSAARAEPSSIFSSRYSGS